MLDDGSLIKGNEDIWQLRSCSINQNYKKSDISDCLGNRNVYMIGDSSLRDLYNELLKKLDLKSSNENLKHSDKVSSNDQFKFFWDPYLNSTQDILEIINDNDILILSSGLWYLRYDSILNWSNLMDNLFIKSMNFNYQTMLLPIQHPNVGKLSVERSKAIKVDEVDAMNADLQIRARNISNVMPYQSSSIVIPFSFNEIFQSLPMETDDGLHYTEKVKDIQSNILLNYWCNDLQKDRRKLNDVTCCTRYKSPVIFQKLFIISLIFSAFALKLIIQPRFRIQNKIVGSIYIILAILSVAYIVDRTHIVQKINKNFNIFYVILTIIFLFIGGLKTLQKTNEDDINNQNDYFNRNQSDEMKGWMQVIILIYHYYSGSSIHKFYIPIRVLVSAYIFISGYGHSIYFLKSNSNITFKRLLKVLFKLNFLTLMLCNLMNTDYILYYFTPIITIWFVVIFLTFYIKQDMNGNLHKLSIKLFISLIITALIINLPPLISNSSKYYINSSKTLYEYYFRLNLDLYSPFMGCLLGGLMTYRRNLLSKYKYIINVMSIATLILFSLFLILTNVDKFTYNIYHPYFSPIVVFSYINIRNYNEITQSYSSTLFSMIGKCSLELFLLQFHLLLGGDSKLNLNLLPNNSNYFTFLINLIILIHLSNYASTSTNTLIDIIFNINHNLLPFSISNANNDNKSNNYTTVKSKFLNKFGYN